MNGAVVLLIEDQNAEHSILSRKTRGANIVFLPAFTVEEARKLIEKNIVNGLLNVHAVVINACMGTHDLSDSISLLEKIQGCFHGPIIATSNEGAYREEMKHAGCQYVCDHDSLPEMLVQALGL